MKFTCAECGLEVSPEDAVTHADTHIGSQFEVPDVIGEIEAWRAWKVRQMGTETVALYSATRPFAWLPKSWTVAECNRVGKMVAGRKTGVPHEGHACGLYAARDRDHLLDMNYNAYSEHEFIVIGKVGLSGKVIPGTQGWRAEKGRIISIEVPYERWKLCAAIEKTYGCEVGLAYTLGKKDEKEDV